MSLVKFSGCSKSYLYAHAYCSEYQGRRYKLGVDFRTDIAWYRKIRSLKDAGVTVTISMGFIAYHLLFTHYILTTCYTMLAGIR